MDEGKEQVLKILEETYQGTTTALEYSTPFQLLVATILSAQTTDIQVNKLTRKLFAKYPGPEELARLTEEELAEEIKGCGLFRNKAKNVLATTRIILAEHGGEVPKDRDSLMKLPGVGRKTANVVLANAFGIPALAVDTHVFRVANRLGLAQGQNPEEVEEQLMAVIPEEKWAEAHHWLIWHGRQVCKAQKPVCLTCPLKTYCPRLLCKEEKENGEE